MLDGLQDANSNNGDGYSVLLKWSTGYPSFPGPNVKIGYNIYMSSDIAPTFPNEFFNQSPMFLSIDGSTSVVIEDLLPGQMYHFGVRAFEYNTNTFDPTKLPSAYNGLVVLPQSLLRSNISDTDTIIPLVSTEGFPSSGTVKIGGELIFYSGINSPLNNLIIPAGSSSPATLVDQGGGHFYTANGSNVGSGLINNLTVVGIGAKTETWTIKCVEVLRDNTNTPIPGTARFIAIGSLSGSKINGQDYVWIDDGVVNSNTILSFSITELSPFKEGDFFIVKVAGASPFVPNGRGYNGTVPEVHQTDGYDGYVFWDPTVIFWPVEIEEKNTRVFQVWVRFDIDQYSWTVVDGYRQKTKDILTTDLSLSDQSNLNFPAFDFAGYHRTDPVLILNGTCVGSYIGGYQFCADGYSGVGQMIRGISVQDANLQRQEVLLSTTGEPCVLLQRRFTGITCSCMLPYNENPMNRCRFCFGGGVVVSYEQFFYNRRSDGRIMVRFDPAVDDLVATDSGLEPQMLPTCWTTGDVTVKDRFVLVRFQTDQESEEFRYEILNVTRNRLFLAQEGVQKFAVQRIRKTDPIYQIPVLLDSSSFPMTITTSIESSIGIPPHSHTIVIDEHITSITQINQLTSVAMGHNHEVRNGVVLTEDLGHMHSIVL